MELIKQFFSPEDVDNFQPVGMFNITHFLAFLVCICFIGMLLKLTKNSSEKEIIKFTKIAAVGITILELIKIGYNFFYGYKRINNWLPLHYCSLFIYSLWITGFGKGKVHDIGASFLVGGGIAAGLSFLIVPSSSLTMHPLFHYLCIYSLLFHSLMIFFGLLYLSKGLFIPTLKKYHSYMLFISFFMVIALLLNNLTGSNFMFFAEPFKMPFKFLEDINNAFHIGYTFFIIICYSILYFVPCGLYYLIKDIRFKKEEKYVSN